MANDLMAEKNNIDILYDELDILKASSSNDAKIRKDIQVSYKKFGVFRKKLQKEYILKNAESISLLGLCETLKAYRNYIFEESTKFKKICKNKKNERKKIYEVIDINLSMDTEPILVIEVDISTSTNFYRTEHIVLDCSDKLPIVSSISHKITNDTAYEILKPYLFDYFAVVYNYRDFLKTTLCKTFNIGEISTLSINAPDLINKGKINIEIKFSDFAVLNVIIEEDNITSVVFSGDNKVNNFLRENKEQLLESIFIKESKFCNLFEIIETVKVL